MDALGNPQRRLRAVHITGTNGKGSTAAICAELLAASHLEVGLFTSPHLSRAYERIVVMQCRDDSLRFREPYGVWGVLAEDERNRMLEETSRQQ